jgi:hypothetical protein
VSAGVSEWKSDKITSVLSTCNVFFSQSKRSSFTPTQNVANLFYLSGCAGFLYIILHKNVLPTFVFCNVSFMYFLYVLLDQFLYWPIGGFLHNYCLWCVYILAKKKNSST